MHIHTFLVDQNNEGRMFFMSVQGIKATIQSALYALSNDVRFVKTSKKLHRNDKGQRRFPWGKVVASEFSYDKLSTFSKKASKLIDERKVAM